MKRNAWTLYLYAVAAGGFSVAIAAVLLVPELPVAAPSLPTVVITTVPGSPRPAASSPSRSSTAPVVGVGGSSSPRIVLVGTTPTAAGLHASSSSGASPGPTVAPTPSATTSGTPTPSPSQSSAPTETPSVGAVVALDVLGVKVDVVPLLPDVEVSVGLP